MPCGSSPTPTTSDQFLDTQVALDKRFGGSADQHGVTAIGLVQAETAAAEALAAIELAEQTDPTSLDRGARAVQALYRDQSALDRSVATVKQAAEKLFGASAADVLAAIDKPFSFDQRVHRTVVDLATRILRAPSAK